MFSSVFFNIYHVLGNCLVHIQFFISRPGVFYVYRDYGVERMSVSKFSKELKVVKLFGDVRVCSN